MTIPASFLNHLEQHGCITGCFGSESDILVCLHSGQPLQQQTVISCRDCFCKFAILKNLLTSQTSSSALATEVSRHLHSQRGFTWALSGYFTNGPGMWFRVAYIASGGLFLLDGDRSRQLGSDIDQLMLAFQHGILQSSHPQMIDPKQYATETVYLRFTTPFFPITNRQDLLASPHCRSQPAAGYQRATLALFLPQVAALPPAVKTPPAPIKAAPANAPAVNPTGKKTLQMGSLCPKCNGEIKVRSLLNATFIGCLC